MKSQIKKAKANRNTSIIIAFITYLLIFALYTDKQTEKPISESDLPENKDETPSRSAAWIPPKKEDEKPK